MLACFYIELLPQDDITLARAVGERRGEATKTRGPMGRVVMNGGRVASYRITKTLGRSGHLHSSMYVGIIETYDSTYSSVYSSSNG
jgi:hypothetical protein